MADILAVAEVRTGAADIPYVIVQVEWDGLPADRPFLRVLASYVGDGGTDSYVLRGSTEAHPGDGVTRTLVDPQAPFDRDVTYTAQWATDPDIGDWENSPWDVTSVSDTVAMSALGVSTLETVHVLSRPGDIEGTLGLQQLDNRPPRSSDQPGSLVRVQGRARPVPLWDVRTSESGTLQLRCETAEQLRALRELVADGAPVLSRYGRSDSHMQPPREIVQLGGISGVLVGPGSGTWVDLGFTVVDDPEPDVASTVGDFDDMQTAFAAAPAPQEALVLDGTVGSYTSTPDNAALDIVGDIDLRVEATSGRHWRPTAQQSLIAKWGASGQRSYMLAVRADGTLEFSWSANGSTVLTAVSTVPIPNTAAERLTLRATIDVDNGAAGRTVTFFTAPDILGTYTQLGATVTTAGVTSIFNSTAVLEVGAQGAGTLDRFTRLIHKAQVRSSIGGTQVANPDFTIQTVGAGSFVDAAGRTWTIQANADIAAYFDLDDVTAFFSGLGLTDFADVAAFDWWSEANA